MEILFCDWHVFGTVDMMACLRKIGFGVHVFDEGMDTVDYDVAYINKLSEKINACKADCVFSNNYIPIISRVCQVHRIPYISWCVDCPMIMLYSETVCNSCNYIFLFDWKMYQTHKDKNPGHIFYMPLGGNVDRMDQLPFGKAERKEYAAQVSFVGSLYYKRSRYNQTVHHLSPYLRGYTKGLIEAQCLVYGQNFLTDAVSEEIAERYFAEVVQPVGEDYTIDEREIVGGDMLSVQCTYLERVRLLNSIAEHYQLDLYTKEDMERVPKARYRGTVDYLTEMPNVFRASKINLNFTSKSIQTGLPLRIFDIMGAGGFLLTNYQQELPEYFEIGKDLAVYESEQDLIEKIGYYLEHEEERKEIAKHGYQKVKESMQMMHRMQDIFATFQSVHYNK